MTNLNQPSAQSGSYSFAIKLMPGLQLLLDSLVLLLSGFVLYYSQVFYSYKSADFYHSAIIFNWLVTIMLFYFSGLYQFEALIGFSRTIDRIMISIATAFVFMIALAFSVKVSSIFSRVWVGAFFCSSLFGILAVRYGVATIIARLGKNQTIARNVAIYGIGPQLEYLLDHLKKTRPPFFNLCGAYSNDKIPSAANETKLVRTGSLDDLMQHVRDGGIDDIVLALPWAEKELVTNVVQRLRELPTYVYLCVDIAGFSVPLRESPSYFRKLPFFEVIGKPLSGWDVLLKVAEDYILGTLLLILVSPLLLIVAILIKLTSPGPVIFTQKRLGFNNQPFNIYKFRSMIYQPVQSGQTIQAKKADPRVTSIGRILRKTSIDELPQLLNVLNGTMSLVGPRPHAIDHNQEYAQKIRGYFSRHRVKPGITGLAQIKGYRGITDTIDKMEGRVKYDIEYTDTWSPMLDVKILFLTIFITISGRNAL
jgi:putative colanic acid biosysnthesis UDP-glucose lipid carrier transferase